MQSHRPLFPFPFGVYVSFTDASNPNGSLVTKTAEYIGNDVLLEGAELTFSFRTNQIVPDKSIVTVHIAAYGPKDTATAYSTVGLCDASGLREAAAAKREENDNDEEGRTASPSRRTKRARGCSHASCCVWKGIDEGYAEVELHVDPSRSEPTVLDVYAWVDAAWAEQCASVSNSAKSVMPERSAMELQ